VVDEGFVELRGACRIERDSRNQEQGRTGFVIRCGTRIT
jgi:hypothetical protein